MEAAWPAEAPLPSRPAGAAGAAARWLPWLAALLPFLLLALWRAGDGPGLDADDHAHYLMHAAALVEGRPYADVGYIYTPFNERLGPRLAPPGLPVTLAAAYRTFGRSATVTHAVMLCFALGFALFAGLYFARHGNTALGFPVALLCGLSPGIINHATQPFSDLPFAALAWVLIHVVDRPGPLRAPRIVLIASVGLALMLFRAAGVAIIPAFLLYAVVRYRDHRWRAFVPPAVWTGILAITSAAGGLHPFAVVRLNGLGSPAGAVLAKARTYLEAILDSHLQPLPWDTANDAFHVMTMALMTVGLIAWLVRSRIRFATTFALSYAALLLVVPVFQPRYLWPLFPFFIFGLLHGVHLAATRLRLTPRAATIVTIAFAAALVPPAAAHVLAQPRDADLTRIPAVRDLFDWLQQTAAGETVRVTFYKPRTLAWATGVPAMGPLRATEECVLAELRRRSITHVVVGGLTPSAGRGALATLARTRGDLFAPAFTNEVFLVYRFDPSSDATVGSGCSAP